MHDDAQITRLRIADAKDATRIAALHASSWRSTYRGVLSEDYLNGPVEAERHLFWRIRLDRPRSGLWTVMAEGPDGSFLGFLCLLFDHAPRWGTLIDNLHVRPDLKRRGVGRLLMRAAARHLLAASAQHPVHLYVGEANRPAQDFYHKFGGEAVERLLHDEPDGGQAPVLRFAWASPAALAAAAGA